MGSYSEYEAMDDSISLCTALAPLEEFGTRGTPYPIKLEPSENIVPGSEL